MSGRTLARLTPTIAILAAMGYAAYTIPPPPPGGGDVPPAGRDRRGEGAGPPSAPAADPTPPPRARNPFLAAAGAGPSPVGGAALGPGAEPVAAAARALTLNATFIQGGVRYASIDGRLYRQGQSIAGPDGRETPLAVSQVAADHVVLVAGGARYTLAYPDDLSPRPAARDAGPRGGRATPRGGPPPASPPARAHAAGPRRAAAGAPGR
ncbi:hypothetical protein OJF2_44170 [Aquisphaera giovannonii]|uniref:Type II secretion system protein GspC N-terminal domain-containing protein n=1 Tax=Aquisphaera giovannonii TaxID=406548 RepID=A0A5B9W7F6_9BACT|nr:hypothetical protein [Aquisphaera giovannonii]QEH35860.1 hypothetical protein OJF2_44170 [Aquisphaera giovannonii]